MSDLVVHNLQIVGIVILLMFGVGLIMKKGLIDAQKTSDRLAIKLANKLRFKYSLVVLEFLFVFLIILFWFLLNRNHPYWMLSIMFLTYLITATGAEIRRNNEGVISLLKHLGKFFDSKDYFTNRFFLFLNQLPSIMFLIFVLIFTLTIFTSLKWPEPYYYVGLVALPIYSNWWIYFSLKLRLNEEDTMNVRRIIAYSVLAIYMFVDMYSKFMGFFHQQISTEPNVIDFFLYAGTVIFITIDRVLKAWTDDYKKFHQRSKLQEDKIIQIDNSSIF